jgi:hypothetical protein
VPYAFRRRQQPLVGVRERHPDLHFRIFGELCRDRQTLGCGFLSRRLGLARELVRQKYTPRDPSRVGSQRCDSSAHVLLARVEYKIVQIGPQLVIDNSVYVALNRLELLCNLHCLV